MKNFIIKTTAAISSVLASATAYSAYAQTSIPNPLGENATISSVIVKITDFIFNLGIAISFIVFMIGGFQYLFSGGSEDKLKNAKNTLLYGVIGVIIMLVGKSVTAFIKNLIA